jgi:hypothetical protein
MENALRLLHKKDLAVKPFGICLRDHTRNDKRVGMANSVFYESGKTQ